MNKRILFLLILFLAILPVSANSAMTRFDGSDGQGVMNGDKDCPVVVDHEDLTFTLKDFPAAGYYDDLAILNYHGSFTAAYTFRNPGDTAVEVLLSFPFGSSPFYYHKSQSAFSPEELARYSITCSGEPVETISRYTYSENGFSVEKDLAALRDEYQPHDFFQPDLPVHAYTYSFSCADAKDEDFAEMRFSFDPAGRRISLNEYTGFQYGDSECSVSVSFRTDETAASTLYVFGKDFDDAPVWYNPEDDSHASIGKAELIAEEIMTFEEYIFRFDHPSDISNVDWYNAWIDMLDRQGIIIDVQDPRYGLMRWLQYTLRFEPGETLVNTVTAPCYPTIESSYEPPVYTYSYLLSPASTWKEFGSLKIEILTDFFMQDQEKTDFTKTEQGYEAVYDSLPEGELEFSLAKVENPGHKNNSYVLLIIGFLAFSAVGFLLLVLLIIFLIRAALGKTKH